MEVEGPVRVLVVDDSTIYRRIICDVLDGIAGVEAVGTAENGHTALEQIHALHPDLVTLDVEMPVMDGLATLREIRAQKLDVSVVMLSALTRAGSQATLAALEHGALDFIVKPSGGSAEAHRAQLRHELETKVLELGRVLRIRRLLRRKPTSGHAAQAPPPGAAPGPANRPTPAARGTAAAADALKRMQQAVRRSMGPPRVIAVGISTGGPQTLKRWLPALPAELPVPVLLVQHMPPVFTKSLADDLNQRCALRVVEAENDMAVKPGRVLIAPGGKQMKVVLDHGSARIQVTDDPPENSCRPSVDYLFRSVADVYGQDGIAVIMTGMGDDGARGCRQIKQRGGLVVAQDEQSCVVFGMPRKPVAEGIADFIGSPEQIGDKLIQLVERRMAACR